MLTILLSATPYHGEMAGLEPVAIAQSSNETAQDLQYSLGITAPLPDWIKNNTNSWVHGKIKDSEFTLGLQYLIANDFISIPQQHTAMKSGKPIPAWIKEVAEWWVDGNISDYEFLANIKYLIIQHDLILESDASQITSQDSNLLKNNFPAGRLRLDNVTLDVQIANTTERQIEGLQFQQPLTYSQGMIFVFEQPQAVSMWMKDMKFPLDMIWLDGNGRVTHIEKNLLACIPNQICPAYDGGRQDTKYVLEVSAGFVDKFDITQQSRMDFH